MSRNGQVISISIPLCRNVILSGSPPRVEWTQLQQTVAAPLRPCALGPGQASGAEHRRSKACFPAQISKTGIVLFQHVRSPLGSWHMPSLWYLMVTMHTWPCCQSAQGLGQCQNHGADGAIFRIPRHHPFRLSSS